MQIDNSVEPYTILDSTPISTALSKLNEQKQKILFVVNEFKVVTGAFTDGDFRRWIISSKSIDLSTKAGLIANKSFIKAKEDATELELAELFSEKITIIPLLDDEDRITAVAKSGKQIFSIGPFNLNEKARSLIIAEIGNNHNGCLEEAKRLVDSAKSSGADCVKFQMRDLDTLYVNQGSSNDPSADLGTQYVLDLLSRFQLSDEDFIELFDYCSSQQIPALCTPFDKVSADKLENMGIAAYKISSADLTNHELLTHIALKKKPIIISTGMSREEEIISSIRLLRSRNANFVMLHCNSTYPCPFEDINLSYLKRLSELSNNIVGYSGHERGINIAIGAVAFGAKIIEKHFTHSTTQEGNDHKVSLLPDEFKRMVEGIRELESSLGNADTRKVSQGEMMNRETLGKSVVASKDIAKGQIISESMLTIMSPGKGIPPYHIKELVGRSAKRDFIRHDFFYQSDLSNTTIKARKYNFKNPFGLPVRYHDFERIISLSNLDFVEFHLSYKDLDVKLDEILSQNHYELDCIVHAPELFSGDHLLDLCSLDDDYRKKSVRELQRVIDITKELKNRFRNKNKDTLIVVNVGGFSKNSFLSNEEKSQRLSALRISLSELDTNGVELIPQTMPPYPWHFGGQQYHNLFVHPDEIFLWCKSTGMRICLDVSHTALSCNFLELDLVSETKKLAKHVAHLHIADASGTKQEGLQISEGAIDFTAIYRTLEQEMPNAYWLPEIWQGHKNDGEGFWIALDRIEQLRQKNCTMRF